MLEKLKNMMPSSNTEKTKEKTVSAERTIEKTKDELYNDLLNKIGSSVDAAGKDSLKYLSKFSKYQDNINEYVNIFQYLRNAKTLNQRILISVEVLESVRSHGERKGLSLLRSIMEKQLNCTPNGYSLNVKNILANNLFTIGEFEEKLKNSYAEIDDLDLVFEKDIDTQRKFAEYLNQLTNCILIFRGTKENLDQIFSLMDFKPNFSFNYGFEYDYEELKTAIAGRFKSKFALEEDWEKYLRLYLAKPSESKKTKGYNYFYYLTEELKKQALVDVSQEKSSDGRILIKNSYFGVSTETSDFKNLKSLKKLARLIGMHEAKKSVEELIAYLEFNQKLQAKMGKAFPLNLHMMFTGSPGTGKTTLARIIADILFELGYIKNNNLVEVDKKDLVSQWVGHTAIKTNEVIQKAKGGVLFIDEAYSIVDDKFGKDAIATLIKAMEDNKTELVVIFAGYKDEMEDFINSNPGIRSRIGKKIHFDDYSQAELMEIYDAKLEDFEIKTMEETKVKLMSIIDKVRTEENFGNGRFIDNLIQDILFQHAVNTQGCADEETIFTIVDNDIPDKFTA